MTFFIRAHTNHRRSSPPHSADTNSLQFQSTLCFGTTKNNGKLRRIMHTGELLTRVFIWLALGGYTLGAVAFLLGNGRPAWLRTARWAWTLGCVFFLVHVACAFQFYHAWSHGAAYRETARQTGATFGEAWAWGGGVYVSYAFTLLWLLDVSFWWLQGLASYRQRPAWLTAAWHGFFVFILFNGTVVFESGPARWFGLLICATLLACWLLARRQRAMTVQRA